MSDLSSNKQILESFSNGMADAVAASGFTVSVDARKRIPVSGVLVKPDLIVSVDHGVETEDHIQVILPGGGVSPAALVGRDPGSDLAVLRLENHQVSGTTLPIGAAARVGQPVIAVGKPEPEGLQASFGIVTTMGAGLRTMKGSVLEQYVATDATPYPGFSGGPLLSITGQVLGINTSGLVGGLSLAIPIDLVLKVSNQLEQHGRVKRGFLGIRSQRVELSQNLRAENNLDQATGLLLVGVEQAGPAAEGGLLLGDILINIEGQSIEDQDDLFMRLTGDVVGKNVALEILRGGKISTVMVKVGERA
jgi:S1-C subfamily serine protease